MTKQELMENCTVEQIADMVSKLQSASEVKNDEIHKLKWQISSLEEDNGRLQAKLDTYNNFLLPRCTKEAEEKIGRNCFGEVMIVTYGEWKNKNKGEEQNRSFLETIEKIEEYTDARAEDLAACGAGVLEGEVKGLRYVLEKIKGFRFDVGELEDLKEENNEKQKEIKRLQSEVEKYRKAFEGAKKERDCQIAEYQNRTEKDKTEFERAKNTINQIDDILEKLFGVRHDIVDKPDEFEKILSDKLKENVTDFLPTEPIRVANMLITAEGDCEPLVLGNGVYNEKYRMFDVSELRQIAEHLLVYCNHNGEVKE